MHLRHGTDRHYRVVRVNVRAQMAELAPMFIFEAEPVVEVSFEDIAAEYHPTLLLDAPDARLLAPRQHLQQHP